MEEPRQVVNHESQIFERNQIIAFFTFLIIPAKHSKIEKYSTQIR